EASPVAHAEAPVAPPATFVAPSAAFVAPPARPVVATPEVSPVRVVRPEVKCLQRVGAPSRDPIAGRREPTGPQRIARTARALGLEPRELVRRAEQSRCALCNTPVAFARTYFLHKHTCATCEPRLSSALAASLLELDRWL
ncbi:hypothetical protein L6R52_38520, partial [Myxococcota bacterium]|nr:hypothetical protein [Myxococcota bacterium]